jgi:hypothetical protein
MYISGYLITKRFSIWLGDNVNDELNGTNRSALLDYDVTNDSYTVTPYFENGATETKVIIKQADGKTATRVITATTTIVLPHEEDAFILTFDTSLGDGAASIALPTVSGQAYAAYVDWGDGTDDYITAYNDAVVTHTYATGGVYQVIINNKFGGWSFNNTGDKAKLISIDQWGDVGFEYLVGGFYGCSNLTTLATDGIKSSVVTSIYRLFANSGITSIPENLFRSLPNISNAAAVFYEVKSFTALPQKLFWYNTQITSFNSTFRRCVFTSVPTDFFRYNVNVTDMTSVFSNIIDLELPQDIFRYNTEVTSFTAMNAAGNLVNMPTRLFYYNSKVTKYSYALYPVYTTTVVGAEMFNLSNLSIVTTFDKFMQVYNASNSSTGTIQDIWNYATSATHADAFTNQTALTNYADIPNDWKGL